MSSPAVDTACRRRIAGASGAALSLGPAAAAERAGLRGGVLSGEPVGQDGIAAGLVGSEAAAVTSTTAAAGD
jgi:hypothetical protein